MEAKGKLNVGVQILTSIMTIRVLWVRLATEFVSPGMKNLKNTS